jgi:hypothetical protein
MAQRKIVSKPTAVTTRIGTLEFTHSFADGYPTEETVEKLYDERDFQRACQLYLWSLPAVSMAEWQHGQASFGGVLGTVAAAVTFNEKLGILTPNATTPYYLCFLDLSKGPMVVDLPPGVRGGIIDAWQCSVKDTAKPAKYLLIGPGQDVPPDAEGLELRLAATNLCMVGLRITSTDAKEGSAQLSRFSVFPYAKRAAPSKTRLVSPKDKVWSGVPQRDLGYWERLDEVVQREPIEARDVFFHDMLRPLGIEKGKRFKPDARQKKVLLDAVVVGEAMARVNTFERRFAGMMYRPRTRWHFALQLDADNPAAFWDLLDQRASWFYEAVTASPEMAPKRPGPSSAYLGAYKDKAGQWLDGGRSYRLRVPPNAPMKLFWSVTLYDVSTRSLLVNEQKIADRSSRMDLQANKDGSIDIYCSPQAPANLESNWIPTVPGKSWFAYFRLYEPTQAYFDRSWPLGDFVALN